MHYPSSVPQDRFTPFGLLNNPGHTWKMSRLGVYRSEGTKGLRWLYPSSQMPRVTLSIRPLVRIGSEWVHLAEALARGGEEPFSPYHSKNLLALATPGKGTFVIWFPVRSGVLGFRLLPALRGITGLGLLLEAKGETAEGLWEFGWLGKPLDPRTLCLRSYAEGPVFCTRIGREGQMRFGTPVSAGLSDWVRVSAAEGHAGREGATAAILWLEPPAEGINGVIALGWSESDARKTADEGLARLPDRLAAGLDEDGRFWSGAPRLEGDWPAHWKRGWVYDFETLRMVVREPVGIFRGHWDGMQVQKPRLVLAETAVDAWTLALANPRMAQELVETCFLSSSAPNVPCLREDGSTNMVCEDGSECGTGPNWCLPFTALREIFLMGGDRSWLERLIPKLEGYVRWWLQHRLSSDGHAFFKCSWESGQDCSARFRIPQPTGGERVEHLAPVDLEAGLLDAARTLALFRRWLGLDAQEWVSVGRDRRRRLRTMWRGDGFRDLDRRDGSWVNADDVASLAPFAVAGWPASWRAAAWRQLEHFSRNPRPWLEWPSFWLFFAEAAIRTGWAARYADVLAWRVDSVYRAWDRRRWSEGTPVPGVAAECWGMDSPRGAEGYGWGASLPLHLLRGFLGLRYRQTREGQLLGVQPHLPPALEPGTYSVQGIRVMNGRVSLTVEKEAEGTLALLVERAEGDGPVAVWDGKWRRLARGESVRVPVEPGAPLWLLCARGKSD